MRFVFNLTLRETRSSWQRLLFFFLCISIGVGSIVALRSFIQNLNKAVAGDARNLLTADFEISSTSPFSPRELAIIDSVLSRYDFIEARTETVTTAAMARTARSFQFVELKGIEEGFPLVGQFLLLNGSVFDYSLLKDKGAVVHSSLLERLNLSVGDKISIGTSEFTIRGTFYEEPGGSGGFRLGPRVFVEKRAFDEAGLTLGRVRRKILFRTSDDPTPIVAELRDAFKGTILTVTSYKEAQENVSGQFQRLENYLSLTGLLILVLGGVGIWNVARAFIEQKRLTIAILKCLGAVRSKILLTYLLQILLLSLIGSLLGVFLAQVSLWVIKAEFAQALPKEMSYFVQPSAVIQGLVVGLVVSMIFSVLPLLQIRNIKPNLLLRDENNVLTRKIDRAKLLFAILSIVLLLCVMIWQAGSIRVGLFFLFGSSFTAAILYFSAVALMAFLRKLNGFRNFALLQAINSLYRPGNQTRIVILAVGLGVFVILLVHLLQRNLIREFDFAGNLPSVFLVDIQRSQLDEVKSIVDKIAGSPQNAIPTVRARIVLVNDEPFDFEKPEVRQQQGQIGREFAVTYRDYLDKNETLIAGNWWQDDDSDLAQVSVEERMSRTLKVDIGDRITFDISGRRVEAIVKNIRKINLRSTQTAFVFVFRPGKLEKAPQTFLLPVTAKLSSEKRAQMQKEIIEKFPNVQFFDTADILQAVKNLLNNFVLGVSFVGGFVVLTGILILIGSIALTRSQRIYENAILKTLGANRFVLTSILVIEYSTLGFLAGFLGAMVSVLLSYLLTTQIFQIEWSLNFVSVFVAVVATTLFIAATGFLSCFNLIFKKPLFILRSQ
ncbi:MAG: ABC transporter permease [Pyrinomonadaceae bacterium]|nr:ABC transporter permease [Pyrinomonadaceae bacterium]MCX7640532.1 ABC transporter permease [Pyrinomonadaceae bacterium]MDW8303887.1 FtsX-like permease family protein [Acidobacteriota bacterium]